MLFPNQKAQLRDYVGRLIWKLFEIGIVPLSKKEEEEHYKEWKKNHKTSLISNFPLYANPDSEDYLVQVGLAVSGDPRKYNDIISKEKDLGIFDSEEWEDFIKLLNKLKKSDIKKHFK